MALIEDGKISVVVGITINSLLLVVKFVAFLYSKLNLLFADAIDSVSDMFILFILIVFLNFNFESKVTFLNMDIMLGCQWSAIMLFRIMILLDQISDLISPQTREQPLIIIIVSCIVLVLGLILAVIFVDEDDVIKCFITEDEKAKRKIYRSTMSAGGKKTVSILPIFAEALDNLATTSISLIVGSLLYCEIAVDYLYLIDDIGNMAISAIMMYLAWDGLRGLIHKFQGKSHFYIIYDIDCANVDEKDDGYIGTSDPRRSLIQSGST